MTVSDVPDYDAVPETFFTPGWWTKPDPFPMTPKRAMRDLEDQEFSLTTVQAETFSGRNAGTSGDPEDDHESQYNELGMEYDTDKEGQEL